MAYLRRVVASFRGDLARVFRALPLEFVQGLPSPTGHIRPFSSGENTNSISGMPRKEDPLQVLQAQKRVYRAQISLLRKQYAEEHAERQRNKEKAEKEKRDLRQLAHASEIEASKRQAAARKVFQQQQQEELKSSKEALRLMNEARRKAKEEREGEKKSLRLQKLNAESRMWVSAANLERRINEAIDDPYTL